MRPRAARLALAPVLLGAFLAPGPAGAQERIVWHGVELKESHGTDVREGGPPPQDHTWSSRVEVRFRYVEVVLPDGTRQFIERRLDWTLTHHSEVYKIRGARELMAREDCQGSGSLDLGPNRDDDFVTAEQERELRPACESWSFPTQWGYWARVTPSVYAPRLVRADCHHEEEPGHSYDVWQARTEAAIEVPEQYASFLPEPGERLSLTARARVPVRFRFALEDTSSFAGFATNASVDARFFRRYPRLAHLADRYRDGDPDLIFDPQAHPPDLWNPLGWTGLLTKQDGTEATVDVKAMDYGAWGRLRAFAKSGCGGWEPVPFRQAGAERESLVIPLDDDQNLMADALLPVYRGDPGSDLDETPDGDGTPGDGLTLFEEYRGFLTLDGACNPGAADRYLRTAPARKDLFVHSLDPALARLALRLAPATDLAVHCIRDRHFLSRTSRVVNLTLQESGHRRFRGFELSQAEPQHGLYLVNRDLSSAGVLGMVYPVIGPPRAVQAVLIDKEDALASGPQKLAHVVLHELAHAVNVRHHGHGNVQGPLALLDQADCPPALGLAGRVGSRRACRTDFIAVRGAQNSGKQTCPMKYTNWRWYVLPGSTLVPFGDTQFSWRDHGQEFQERLPAYSARVGRYDKAADSDGMGPLCSDVKGTGINAASRGMRNHAGDSTRSCAQQIRVNDVDAWGTDAADGE